MLGLAGWSFSGEIPDVAHAVIIVGPHTSNWDFVVGAAGMLALDLRLRFLAKHTVFRWPLGTIMRLLGGLPVDRSRPQAGRVDLLAGMFRSSEKLFLALAPEGTRRPVERWHTGFYRIAVAAGVPIIPVALDYASRTIRLGEPLRPTSDVSGDLGGLQEFMARARGFRPQPPVFRS